ncbi:MAG: hypothetical protein FWD61_18825 [Phycisphaerales bacterium]|nr:hypothetical protein [Phycisphaerales bacterium]
MTTTINTLNTLHWEPTKVTTTYMINLPVSIVDQAQNAYLFGERVTKATGSSILDSYASEAYFVDSFTPYVELTLNNASST